MQANPPDNVTMLPKQITDAMLRLVEESQSNESESMKRFWKEIDIMIVLYRTSDFCLSEIDKQLSKAIGDEETNELLDLRLAALAIRKDVNEATPIRKIPKHSVSIRSHPKTP